MPRSLLLFTFSVEAGSARNGGPMGTADRKGRDDRDDDIPFGTTKVPDLSTATSKARDAGPADEAGGVDDGQAAVVPGDHKAADGDISTEPAAADDAQHAILPEEPDDAAISSPSVIDDGNDAAGRAETNPFAPDPG